MKNYHSYKAYIDACLKCAAICNHCAASCLKEDNAEMMTRCIQLDMECAAVCYAAAQLMSLGSDKASEMCKLCAEICGACAKECSRHDTEHCRECAATCRECADLCNVMAQGITLADA